MERSEVQPRATALLQQIAIVFEGASREGGPARWQEVPEDVLYDYGQAFGSLDDTGFRHYLPVMLTWVLEHLGEGYDDPKLNRGWNTYSRFLLGQLRQRQQFGLNQEQNVAVARFLHLMDELHQLENREQGAEESLIGVGSSMIGTEFQESNWNSYESEEGKLLREYWGRFLGPNPN